jgi:peptidoglycan/xylan/chitin deacetylase (PgdA/CDA1 family)
MHPRRRFLVALAGLAAAPFSSSAFASSLAAGPSSHVPILMYHYISNLPAEADSVRRDLTIRPDTFETQLRYLRENGYSAISLYQLHAHLSKSAALPRKPVVLTFDDGYRDAYTQAFPLLRRHGMKATFFVVTDFVHDGRTEYLTWPMVKEMFRAGMSIESHTRNHIDMRGKSYNYLVWQLLGAIENIQYYTGQRPRFLAYPSGHRDALAIRTVQSAQTWAAVTTEYGRTQTLGNAMAWPRMRMKESMSLAQFGSVVSAV